MESQSIPRARCRRRYSSDFKSRLIAACLEPGALIVDSARAHQVDPLLLRRWLCQVGLSVARRTTLTENMVSAVSASPTFVPVTWVSSPMSLTDASKPTPNITGSP